VVDRLTQQLKLVDFGLSKHLDSVRTRQVGTPDYLAPEMLQVMVGR
jgi:serine/threonine protein kinase